jgi:hypothetical protein
MVSTDMQYGQFSLEPNCAVAALPLPPGAENMARARHSTEKKCLSDNGQLQRKHTTHSEHRPKRTTGELRCERGNEGDIASRGAGTGERLCENFWS